jgi:hypothetical protein
MDTPHDRSLKPVPLSRRLIECPEFFHWNTETHQVFEPQLDEYAVHRMFVQLRLKHRTGQGIDIPTSVTTLADLARSSGNTKMEIWSANLGVTSWASLPRRLNVPGWREHIVVATPAGTTESLTQIARQRDVSVADLNAHNRHHPGWPTLTAGIMVLIPPRGFRP